MKTKIILAGFVMLLSQMVNAQNTLKHTIKQGENLSALAKKYQTTVGDIMRANNMNAKSLLKIGQVIDIPSKAAISNPVVTKPLPTIEVVPTKPATSADATIATTGVTTHEVKAKESLYSISKKYKVSIDELKAWNQLTDYGIKIGQQLIVAKPSTLAVVEQPVTKPTKEPIEKDPMPNVLEKAAPQETLPTAKPQPVVTPPASTNPIEKPATNAKPAITDASATVNNPPVIFQNSKQIIEAEGFFAAYFDRTSQTNNLAGDAGIFKSVSGWGDKKYYVLINNIEPGTIIRVSANGKSVCARVLSSLPNLKEDASLLLRLNNAAARVLGLGETGKWPITVQY